MTDLDRYHRQTLLQGIGTEGQHCLLHSTVLVVGCGALGTVIAESLVRAGVGRLILVDRDVVEWTNLQRQVLFDEADARQGLPKAVAARDRLHRINSQVNVDAVVVDFGPSNAQRIAASCDVILDGTDNFETRFLLNDLSVKHGVPYVYGGAVGTTGMTYTVLPHTPAGDTPWERSGTAGPCLRCIFEDPPPTGDGETCDTVGVLGPTVGLVAYRQAAEAIKLLTGNIRQVNRTLVSFDTWRNVHRQIDVAAAYEQGRCACCGLQRFEHLDGERSSSATTLCGRNAVQIRAPRDAGDAALNLDPIAYRLRGHGRVVRNEFLLRADLNDHGGGCRLTLFPDGRAIVHGTDDPSIAKSIYARYVGL